MYIFSCWLFVGDVSSISGSESDSSREDSASDSGEAGSNNKDTDSSLITGRPSSKVVFQNSAGQYLSVHRCILQGKAKQVKTHNCVAKSSLVLSLQNWTSFFCFC